MLSDIFPVSTYLLLPYCLSLQPCLWNPPLSEPIGDPPFWFFHLNYLEKAMGPKIIPFVLTVAMKCRHGQLISLAFQQLCIDDTLGARDCMAQVICTVWGGESLSLGYTLPSIEVLFIAGKGKREQCLWLQQRSHHFPCQGTLLHVTAYDGIWLAVEINRGWGRAIPLLLSTSCQAAATGRKVQVLRTQPVWYIG